jgi:hypothetical protein
MDERVDNIYREGVRPHRLAFLALTCFIALFVVLAACQGEGPTEEPSDGPTKAALRPQAEETNTSQPTAESRPTLAQATQETAAPLEEPTGTAVPAETAAPAPTRATIEEAATITPTAAPEGALVSVSMTSQVGVLLDEIPEEHRDDVIRALLERPPSYWHDLARRQAQLTRRRLNFRNFVYDNKGQLPMPPQSLWHITLDPAGPQRTQVGTGRLAHDLLTISYTFTATLLSDAVSVAEAEPALADVGGRWDEPFIFPIDPDLMLQRTGNACINEAGFPPNSYDSENLFIFFDYTCQADSAGVLGCHRNQVPTQSCLAAMSGAIGTTDAVVQFERLAWDPDLAESARAGEVTTLEGPDLRVVGSDLDVNRIVYRYFEQDSCALAEQCVSASGWRRLLQFNGTVQNVGAVAMDIGAVDVSNPLNALFQYNSCHNHFHFSDYGDFYFAGGEQNFSSKQAFCVESTDRLSNNEWSPLTHSFSCRLQGVQAGWVDEYQAGLDCQWIDITDVEVPADGISVTLGFTSNPDQFLCEGTPEFDEQGNPVWVPSGQKTADGREINRPACDFVPNWAVNNDDARQLFLLPAGGLMTSPCANGEIGPLRNCGFSQQLGGLTLTVEGEEPQVALPDGAFSCRPGRRVQLACSVEDENAPQVLRVCEFSHLLAGGTACLEQDALANEVISGDEDPFSFVCPVARDEDEPGGVYTFYTTPLYDEGPAQAVSCTVAE